MTDAVLRGGLGRVDTVPMSTVARRRVSRPVASPPDVAAARAGDADAAGRVATAVFRRTLAFFRFSGAPPATAEDLAADTAEAVIGRLGDLRDPGAFDAWVWAIARTRLRAWIRKTRRPAALEPATVPDDGPEELAVLEEEHAALRRALRRLAPRDRELLWLREVEELSYAEIGGRLGASSGAVRVACMRARRRLERTYRETRGGEDG